MVTIIPIASGKGGVGKTSIAANLGTALASQGKTTVLIDLDLGGSNLHTLLGVPNTNPGIGNFLTKETSSIDEVVIATSVPKLYFIPGDLLLPGAANIPFFIKKRIIKEISTLVADYVILDLGSGSANNVIDFFLTSPSGIIVTTPEPTAVLNAYSFLKTALYRLIFRSFSQKSEERKIVDEFLMRRIEGSAVNFKGLVEKLERINHGSAETVFNHINTFYPRVILNMGRSNTDINLGIKLRQIVKKNLGSEVEYIGFVPVDQSVSVSIFKRQPISFFDPHSEFVRNMLLIAQQLIEAPIPDPFVLHDANDDLTNLQFK